MADLLTYAVLDDLAFAAERGRLDQLPNNLVLVAHDLGPLLEYVQLSLAQRLPPPDRAAWLSLNGSTALYAALSHRRGYWVCPHTRRLGVYRTHRRPPRDDTTWIQFGVAARHAAIQEGFPNTIAAQLVGAIGEIESNIYEHSGAPETGIIAFKATLGMFEFVVTDRGIGVLQSLRTCPEYASLSDHGEALQLALTDGVSRYGPGTNRGFGFQPLFTGLANLKGSLRFRSGDHALSIDGQDPVPRTIPMKLGKKPTIEGFFISVACRLHGTPGEASLAG